MTTTHLTREEIAAQFRQGKKPFVIRHMDGRYWDLSLKGIERLDAEGTYLVEEHPHEMVVRDRVRKS